MTSKIAKLGAAAVVLGGMALATEAEAGCSKNSPDCHDTGGHTQPKPPTTTPSNPVTINNGNSNANNIGIKNNNYNNIKNNVDVNNTVKNNVDVRNNVSNQQKQEQQQGQQQSSENTNNNRTGDINIKNPRNAPSGPSVVVAPSGDCGTGFSISGSFLTGSIGGGYSWQGSRCLSIKTAQFLMDEGAIRGKNDILVMGLTMIQGIDDYAKDAGAHVARVTMMGECGKRAMAADPVLASQLNFSCQGKATGHFDEVTRHPVKPRVNVVSVKTEDACAKQVAALKICRMSHIPN